MFAGVKNRDAPRRADRIRVDFTEFYRIYAAIHLAQERIGTDTLMGLKRRASIAVKLIALTAVAGRRIPSACDPSAAEEASVYKQIEAEMPEIIVSCLCALGNYFIERWNAQFRSRYPELFYIRRSHEVLYHTIPFSAQLLLDRESSSELRDFVIR